MSGSLDELLHIGHVREFTLDEMQRWGEAVGRLLPLRTTITLDGDLGAGKTTLARALCSGLGVFDIDSVTSPTFAIIQEYPSSNGTVTHADLYRLRNDSELDALGWDELVEAAAALIVEWPERATRAWPAGTLHIALAYGTNSLETRQISVTTA